MVLQISIGCAQYFMIADASFFPQKQINQSEKGLDNEQIWTFSCDTQRYRRTGYY